MAKIQVHRGKTSKIVVIKIQDATKTDGSGLTGLVFNSAGLTAYYYRDVDASSTVITLATMTAGTWATGGFKEIDATNLPGYYAVGLPNAVFASGESAQVCFKGAANMVVCDLEIELISTDWQDAAKAGMTNLDVVLSTRATPAQILTTPANLLATDATGRVTVGSNADKAGYSLAVAPPTAAAIAALILATPANLIATDSSGRVTVGTNADKTGYTLTVTPPTAAAIAALLLANPGKPLANNAGDGSVLRDLTQLLPAPRDISAVADNAITAADSEWAAVAEMAGQQTAPAATSVYTKKTPAGTTVRIFTTSPNNSAPVSRT